MISASNLVEVSLFTNCKTIVGMEMYVCSHRNVDDIFISDFCSDDSFAISLECDERQCITLSFSGARQYHVSVDRFLQRAIPSTCMKYQYQDQWAIQSTKYQSESS